MHMNPVLSCERRVLARESFYVPHAIVRCQREVIEIIGAAWQIIGHNGGESTDTVKLESLIQKAVKLSEK